MQRYSMHMTGKLRSKCRIRCKVFNLNHTDTAMQYLQFESDVMLQREATDISYNVTEMNEAGTHIC
jgi:hypothetical protein